MFRFLKNLFNIGKKKQNNVGEISYKENDIEIIVNKNQGTMIIKTERNLSDNDIIDIFRKYVLGEE